MLLKYEVLSTSKQFTSVIRYVDIADSEVYKNGAYYEVPSYWDFDDDIIYVNSIFTE